jgi:hypothetical protein
MDISIQSDEIIPKREAEEVLKFKCPLIEVYNTWNLNVKVIPVFIDATGVLSRSSQKYLEVILSKLCGTELQKMASLGTGHF